MKRKFPVFKVLGMVGVALLLISTCQLRPLPEKEIKLLPENSAQMPLSESPLLPELRPIPLSPGEVIPPLLGSEKVISETLRLKDAEIIDGTVSASGLCPGKTKDSTRDTFDEKGYLKEMLPRSFGIMEKNGYQISPEGFLPIERK